MSDAAFKTHLLCEQRSARTLPALIHMSYNADGGLSFVAPWQVVRDEVAFIGAKQTAENPLGDEFKGVMEKHKSIDAYMRNHHGDSWIPSMARFMVYQVEQLIE